MNPAYKKILAKKYGHGPDDQHDAQPDNPQYYESTTATPQFSSTNASSPAQNSATYDEGLRNTLNQYNSSKVVIRPTTEVFPNSKKTHKSTSIPISVIIQPSPMTYGTEEFPTADFGKNNPILRCEECRTYICPFTEFIQGGQRFKCNLCGASNPVPNYYYSHLDANGQREDKYRRPELNYGVYDIKAGNDYMARPPMPPIYYFVIDVSQKGFENGSLDLLSNILNEYVTNDYFWGDVRTKIGFLLYDTNIHLVSLNKKLKQPQLITLTDIENLVRLPIFDNLVVNLSESKYIVTNFVNGLPKMFANTKDNGSNVFNAVRVSASILRRSGGRMYVLQSNPNVIKESSLAATTKDSKDSKDQKSILHPTSSRFTDLTPDMQQNFVSCNLYVFSEGYKNFVTLGELARFLNGEAYYYADGAENNHKFYYDLRSSLSREYTWESVYRLRISSGWKITNKYGNFSIKSSGDLLSLPNSDNYKSLVYEFELEGDVAKHNVFYLQSALLYTNSAGERRIKVTNYGIPLTGEVADIQASIDAQAVATVLLRKGLDLMYRNPSMAEVKKDILTNARQVYTELSRNKSNPPDFMYTLAMTMLGIMKHPIMSDSTWQYNTEADKMNALRIRLNMLGLDELVLYFVPYLFSVHSLTQEDASYYDESGTFVYPQLLNLSMSSLSNVGVYLMDAGDAFYMLVGSQTDPSVLYSLFGINSLADATSLTEEMMYQNQEDPLTVKVSNLINELRSRKTEGYAYLHIFKEGDRSPSEMKFYAKLIEDKMNLPHTYNNSYAEFVNILSMPVVGNQG